MKKITALMAVLVLTLSLFTGCGCTRRGQNMDTMPSTEMTILPTNIPETTAPVIPTTEPVTEPSMGETTESETSGTEEGIAGSDMTGQMGTGNAMG